MRRFTVILLLLLHAGLGTGVFGYLHELTHAAEDAAAAEARREQGFPPVPAPHHDESNCTLHAQLAQPLLAAGAAAALPLLEPETGAALARPDSVDTHRQPRRVDCRGPPLS